MYKYVRYVPILRVKSIEMYVILIIILKIPV